MTRRLFTPFVALLAVALSVGGSIAAVDPATAQGPTVLTVAGKIDATNRGPVDPFDDAFLNDHDIAFERAFAFDRDTLAGLGLHRLVTRYPGSDRMIEVEGPLLRDVLNRVGATGATLSVMALDGYAAEIAIADLRAWPVVLALKSDGEWLGIGGRGPAWVVFPANDYPASAGTDDAKWVWAAFFIRVD